MINLFEPHVDQASLDLLKDVFQSKWLGRGEYVAKFERQLSVLLKTDSAKLHTIACCTDAIFGAFEVLGIEPSGEVIVPSISFPAVGSAILAAGLIPRVVDIDIKSGNIDLTKIAEVISPKTVAVFVTHYGGIPVDIKQLRQLVGPDIFIIEDAACALGTYVDGVACGTEGDFGCWSFDAMKLLTCGEGGGLYVADSDRMNHAKEYFYLGLPAQTKSGIDRQATDSRWWEYQLNMPGRRSMFTNINAAIGLPQFETLPDALERRKAIREYYCQALDKVGVEYLRQDQSNVIYSNYFFTVTTKRRDELASYLKSNNIYSTFRYHPLHLIDIFKPYSSNCAQANIFSNIALNIPIHQSLTDADISYISDALKGFFARD
jgi:dTDP-4-amino-4,6-dideoxygalactose transaminase